MYFWISFCSLSTNVIASSCTSGDYYDSNATTYISWDPKAPVLLRTEEDGPGSYPPILVQTFFRQVVDMNGDKVAIKYKEDNTIKELTYSVRNYATIVFEQNE